MMPTTVDQYLIDGCMRCDLGGTPNCKVLTWTAELNLLRSIVLESALEETIKWGVPCYTINNKNVLMVSAYKHFCCISFFKGALLKDSKKILEKPGENSQTVRLLKFKNVDDISKIESDIRAYIDEAIEIEKSGKKVETKQETEPIPEELIQKFEEDSELKKAFEALTKGRQRGYILYFSAPKQSKTKHSRIEACIEKIKNGEGLHDKYQCKK